MINAVIIQIVVPLLLLIYFIQGTKTALSMLARATVVVGVLWIIRTTAGFLIIPWFTYFLYYGLMTLIALLAVLFRRQIPLSPRRRALSVLRFDMMIGLIVVNVNIYLLLGEAPDYSNIVSLEPPVQGQSVYVMNGGTHSLLNKHISPFWTEAGWGSDDELPASYYGLDLVLVNEDGRPGAVFMPKTEFDYSGYNAIIFSPCSGVVQSVGADNTDGVSKSDLGQITLECGSFEVQLGHLLLRSLVLTKGDRVITGQMLGTLGSALEGWPPFLHLHVHRNEIRTNGTVRVIPVQVSVDDNFLAKGDISP